MNFSQLHERLRTELRRRIDEGSLTGALIARRTGLAQAHVSRFLSGKTNLSDAARDRILDRLNISVEQLLGREPQPRPAAGAASTAFPRFAADDLANADFQTPGEPVVLPNEIFQPSPSLARSRVRERWVALTIARVHADPMRPALEEGDVVLLDRYSINPAAPAPGSAAAQAPNAAPVYALQLTPGATVFRHVTADRPRGLFLLQPANSAFPVQVIPYARPGNADSPVLGRVVALLRAGRFRLL